MFTEILPSAPVDVYVEPKSDKSMNISWSPPFSNAPTVSDYIVNVTMLMSFDPSTVNPHISDTNSSQSVITPHSVQVKVDYIYFTNLFKNINIYLNYKNVYLHIKFKILYSILGLVLALLTFRNFIYHL